VPLARHFCQQITGRYNMAPQTLTPGAEAALLETDWPGNVRQLAHTLERAIIQANAEGSTTLGLLHLFPEEDATTDEFDRPLTWQEALRRAKRRILKEAIEAEEGNLAAVARRLELARSQVYKLREGLGV